MDIDIDGDCPERFAKVKDAFAANFSENGDVGASVAVTVGGELVVDLWGGARTPDGDPWEQDTLANRRMAVDHYFGPTAAATKL